MTSAEIVKRIIGSLLTVVSEDEGEKTPIKSKPALQKAETLVKTAIYMPRFKFVNGTNRIAKSTVPINSQEAVKIITVLTKPLTSER